VAKAWQEDSRYRLHGLESTTVAGWKIHACTIQEGVVFSDERSAVEAF